MRNHTMRNALTCLTTACIAAVPACIFGQSITWLGVLPGDDSSSAKAISSDGKFVVGYSGQPSEYHPFIWTRDDGLIALPRMTEYGSCVATDVTSTPDLIVCGYCNNQYSNSRPVRWVNYTLVPIDTSRYPYGKAWAISPTGRIAGQVEIPNGNPRAVYWDEQGVMEDISNNGLMWETRGISDDNIIVGYMRPDNTALACFWRAGTIVNISRSNTTSSISYAVSNDGRVVVGSLADADGQPNAFRWEDGTSETLGRLPGYRRSFATSTNRDGSVIVGLSDRPLSFGIPGFSAFRWTRSEGLRDLNLVYSNLLTDGSLLYAALDITPDGRYIVGFGFNAATRRTEGYLLDTQPNCTSHNGDVDNNGCVDDGDLLQVLFNFGLSGTNLGRVDINCDETVDDADLLIVLFNFGVGC